MQCSELLLYLHSDIAPRRWEELYDSSGIESGSVQGLPCVMQKSYHCSTTVAQEIFLSWILMIFSK